MIKYILQKRKVFCDGGLIGVFDIAKGHDMGQFLLSDWYAALLFSK